MKDHQERKNEIIDTARDLFLKNRYHNTSVQNIIDAVGIAKGTFYHYFDSKEKLMKDMVDNIIDQTLEIYKIIAENENYNPIEKINILYSRMGDLNFLRSFFQEITFKNEII